MLLHPTLDRLNALGLYGIAKGFKDLADHPEARNLTHAEWLGLLLEHETTLRRQKRFEMRSRAARLRQPATVEDVDYRAARGLDRALFLKLASCDFIRDKRNLIVTGATGVGKSWLSCALGHKACREDLSVLYHRVPRLFTALALARGDGRYAKLMATLAKVKLLILDDWGPEVLTHEQSRPSVPMMMRHIPAGSLPLRAEDRIIMVMPIFNNDRRLLPHLAPQQRKAAGRRSSRGQLRLRLNFWPVRFDAHSRPKTNCAFWMRSTAQRARPARSARSCGARGSIRQP